MADKPIGGLGIHLIRRLTDEVVYRRENDCNVLIVSKHLPPEADVRDPCDPVF